MGLQVVGAGVGRTGTMSLKYALEHLLGAPCYHMIEVLGHPDHVEQWQRAADGKPVDWPTVFDRYAAAVDWPAAAFWPEIGAAFPDAVIVLSTRSDAEAWWRSAHATIFGAHGDIPPEMQAWRSMVLDMWRTRFTDRVEDHDAAIAAYEASNTRGCDGRLIPPV